MGSTENIKAFVKDVTKKAYGKIDTKLENKSLELSDKIDEADVFTHWKNESNIEHTNGYVVEITETGFNLATSTSEIANYTSLSSNGAKYSSGFKNIYNRAFKFNGAESMLSDASNGTYWIGRFVEDSTNSVDIKIKKTDTTYTYLLVGRDGATQEFNGNSWLIPKGNIIQFRFKGTSKITIDAVSVVVYEPVMSDMIESFCDESLYEQMLNKGYTGRESQFISRLYNLIKTEEGEWEPTLEIYYLIYSGSTNVSDGTLTLTKYEAYSNKAKYNVDGTRVSLYCNYKFNKPELTLESGQTAKIYSIVVKGLPFVAKQNKKIVLGISDSKGFVNTASGSIGSNKINIRYTNDTIPVIPNKVESITYNIGLIIEEEYRIE